MFIFALALLATNNMRSGLLIYYTRGEFHALKWNWGDKENTKTEFCLCDSHTARCFVIPGYRISINAIRN